MCLTLIWHRSETAFCPFHLRSHFFSSIFLHLTHSWFAQNTTICRFNYSIDVAIQYMLIDLSSYFCNEVIEWSFGGLRISFIPNIFIILVIGLYCKLYNKQTFKNIKIWIQLYKVFLYFHIDKKLCVLEHTCCDLQDWMRIATSKS